MDKDLAGYSQGVSKSDMTEHTCAACTHTHTHTSGKCLGVKCTDTCNLRKKGRWIRQTDGCDKGWIKPVSENFMVGSG